jgi:hypothetical protein
MSGKRRRRGIGTEWIISSLRASSVVRSIGFILGFSMVESSVYPIIKNTSSRVGVDVMQQVSRTHRDLNKFGAAFSLHDVGDAPLFSTVLCAAEPLSTHAAS